MSYLDNETTIIGLLVKNKLLAKEQLKTFRLKKDQQRQRLLRKIGGRRSSDSKRSALIQPDLVDILVSLRFEIPGKKGKVLTEEVIMRQVADELKIPFKKLDPLERCLARDRYFGSQLGCRAAEPFVLAGPVLVRDPRSLFRS